MSLNTREEICARLVVLLEGLKAAPTPVDERLVTVARNRGKLDNDRLPAGYVLDGDEQVTLPGDRRGRVLMQPVLAIMRPQVFVVLKTKTPQNEGVGQLLNAYRKRIITLFADDAQLRALVGSNGDIAYEGIVTDLKSGMPMDGQMQLNFAFRYFVNVYSN